MMHKNQTNYDEDDDHILCGITCSPRRPLDSAKLVLYSSVVCRFLLEVIFDCSFWGVIFECTIVDLPVIEKRNENN